MDRSGDLHLADADQSCIRYFSSGRKGGNACGCHALDRDNRADRPYHLFARDHNPGESGTDQLTEYVALLSGCFLDLVLCCMDALFYGRTCDRIAEQKLSLCTDAACGISGSVLFVRSHLAAQHSGRIDHADLRCSAYDGVTPIVSFGTGISMLIDTAAVFGYGGF